MSHQMGRAVAEILGRYFGDIVKQVGYDMFLYSCRPIGMIIKSTQLSRKQVTESLRTLLKYDLAAFEPSNIDGKAEYKLLHDNVLLLIRYPRYLLQMKSKYGNEAELLVEELYQKATATASMLIISIANKYKDDKEKNITLLKLRDTFVSLATAGYIQQAPVAEAGEDSDVPTLVPVATIVPELSLRPLAQALASGSMADINDNVYWKVNHDRFHQDFRDDEMIKAVKRRYDENAGELMRHVLQQMYLTSPPWAEDSNPVLIADVRDCCKRFAPDRPLLLQHFDQYVNILVEATSCGFVRQSTDTCVVVAMRRAAQLLVTAALDELVAERLGTHAARVFRVIREKKYIEEDDIQKHAMLTNKLSKELTYKLLMQQFVTIQPMKKPATPGAMAKAVYLYHTDFHQVSSGGLELCYRALHNVLARAEHERRRHARLLAKQRRVRALVHGMRQRGEPAENIEDVEGTITPPERATLESVERRLKQLSAAELELDRTMFLFQWYFTYPVQP